MLWYKDKKPWTQSVKFDAVLLIFAVVMLFIGVFSEERVETKCVPQGQVVQHSPSQHSLTQK